MNVAVNIPTTIDESEYSNCEDVRWDDQRAFGVSVDSLGYSALGAPDHVMMNGRPTTECLTTLAALARETDDVYLYPKTVNDQLRHGPLLAKIGATLDAVSDGRLKLGIGAGWKADEALAYGYEWPDAPTRLRELEESIEVIKALWTEETVSFDGQYYTLDEAMCKPHPVQNPRPPIMVGGGGEEFTLRIAAQHADTWNYWGPPEVMERKLDVLAGHCETYDRSFENIEKSWFSRCIIRETESEVEELLERAPRFDQDDISTLVDGDYEYLVGTPESVIATLEPYVEMGVGEVVVEFVDFPEINGAKLFAQEVIPAFS